jgi:hypothetical protein
VHWDGRGIPDARASADRALQGRLAATDRLAAAAVQLLRALSQRPLTLNSVDIRVVRGYCVFLGGISLAIDPLGADADPHP